MWSSDGEIDINNKGIQTINVSHNLVHVIGSKLWSGVGQWLVTTDDLESMSLEYSEDVIVVLTIFRECLDIVMLRLR